MQSRGDTVSKRMLRAGSQETTEPEKAVTAGPGLHGSHPLASGQNCRLQATSISADFQNPHRRAILDFTKVQGVYTYLSDMLIFV